MKRNFRKPQPKTADEFIGSGGSVASDSDKTAIIEKSTVTKAKKRKKTELGKGKDKTFQLRVPEEIVNQVDELLGKAPKWKKLSRNSWIIEAMLEKLKREK